MTEKELIRANEIQQLFAKVDETIRKYETNDNYINFPKSLLNAIWKNGGFVKFLKEYKQELIEEFAKL